MAGGAGGDEAAAPGPAVLLTAVPVVQSQVVGAPAAVAAVRLWSAVDARGVTAPTHAHPVGDGTHERGVGGAGQAHVPATEPQAGGGVDPAAQRRGGAPDAKAAAEGGRDVRLSGGAWNSRPRGSKAVPRRLLVRTVEQSVHSGQAECMDLRDASRRLSPSSILTDQLSEGSGNGLARHELFIDGPSAQSESA